MDAIFLFLVWVYMLFGIGFSIGLNHSNWRVNIFTATCWPFVFGGFIGDFFQSKGWTEDD